MESASTFRFTREVYHHRSFRSHSCLPYSIWSEFYCSHTHIRDHFNRSHQTALRHPVYKEEGKKCLKNIDIRCTIIRPHCRKWEKVQEFVRMFHFLGSVRENIKSSRYLISKGNGSRLVRTGPLNSFLSYRGNFY